MRAGVVAVVAHVLDRPAREQTAAGELERHRRRRRARPPVVVAGHASRGVVAAVMAVVVAVDVMWMKMMVLLWGPVRFEGRSDSL